MGMSAWNNDSHMHSIWGVLLLGLMKLGTENKWWCLTGNVAEDAENLRQEVERDDVSVITAKLTEIESLSMAFQGCRGVFHTSAFVDPAGLSGYTVSPPDENLLPFLTFVFLLPCRQVCQQ